MNSNPTGIIDSQVIDIWSPSGADGIVHLPRGDDSIVYSSHGVIENTVADKLTKSWASALHEQHALNKTGFSDVQGV